MTVRRKTTCESLAAETADRERKCSQAGAALQQREVLRHGFVLSAIRSLRCAEKYHTAARQNGRAFKQPKRTAKLAVEALSGAIDESRWCVRFRLLCQNEILGIGLYG